MLSKAARLLGWRFQILQGACKFFSCVCCVLRILWPLQPDDLSFREVLPGMCVCVCVCLFVCLIVCDLEPPKRAGLCPISTLAAHKNTLTEASFSRGKKFSPISALCGTCRFTAEAQDPAVNPCMSQMNPNPNYTIN